MKIVKAYPPNIDEIREHFTLYKGVVFTYGDTLYAPDVPNKYNFNPDLIQHEETHMQQQGDNPHDWWKRYLADPIFRREQELEAYQAQYKYCQEYYTRPQRRFVLNQISKDFAGPIYGYVVREEEAKRLIKGLD